jgi:DNA-binding response OmpR family regulator
VSQTRVLLVGGDPDITRTLQVYLDAYHFSVQIASSAGEALAACQQLPPDVVILDWHLPDANAYDLCQQIRAEAGACDSFILALLPNNEREVRLAALEAGADDVMSQRIDLEALRLGIDRKHRRCSS